MAFLLSMWLQTMKRKAAKGARSRPGAKLTRPNRTVLRLEVLEDRTVPSAPSLGPQGAYVQTNFDRDGEPVT